MLLSRCNIQNECCCALVTATGWETPFMAAQLLRPVQPLAERSPQDQEGACTESAVKQIPGRVSSIAQDTGDTRETPAIDVCKGLTADNAKVHIYDPKVTEAQIHNDLALGKFMWDHPVSSGHKSPRQDSITVFTDAYEVRARAHACPPHRCYPAAQILPHRW